MKKNNRSALFLTVGDQEQNRLNRYPNVHLACRFPLGERWGQALKTVCSPVIKLDLRASYLKVGYQKTNQLIIKKMYHYRPKYLIWTADSDLEISEAVLIQAAELGVKRIGIFFDDLTMFDYYPRYWLAYLDYAVTVDSYQSLKQYQALGIPALFEPCCASRQIYQRKNLLFKYPVSFVGTSYGPRQQLVQELAKSGIEVATFGSGWNKQGYISTDEMVNIYNSSKINLNFTNDSRQLRTRMFEVCLSGGFLLTQPAFCLEKLFKIDREIEVFNTIPEAVAKIKYYLHHEKERQAIAKAGYLRARKNYTLEAMFLRIIKAIESGKFKKVKINRELIDKTRLKKRSLRLSYEHAALAIARYLEDDRPELWQEEIELAEQYNCRNALVGLFYFYRLFPKPMGKIISQGVNQIFKLLRRVRWLQNLIVKNIY